MDITTFRKIYEKLTTQDKTELASSETARVLIKQVRGGIVGRDAEQAFDYIVKAEQLYKKGLSDIKDKIKVMNKLKPLVDKEVQETGVTRNNYQIREDLDDAVNKLEQLEREVQKSLNKVKNIN